MTDRWYLPVIVLAYILLASVYSVSAPIFEAPDEVWHYGYVYWVAAGNGLPAPDRGDGQAFWAQEGSQPPLYYLMAGLLTRPLTQALTAGDWAGSVRYNPHAAVGNAASFGNRNYLVHGAWDRWPWHGIALAAHATRLLSIVLGAVTVVFTYLIARRLAPRWELVAGLAAALVAFNPQFLFLTASVSNDNLVTAIGAVGVWLCLRTAAGGMRPPLRALLALGVVVGLAALAKLSGLLLCGLALTALAISGWRLRSWRIWLGGSALVLLVAAGGGRLVVLAQLAPGRRPAGAGRHVRRAAGARGAVGCGGAVSAGAGCLAVGMGGVWLVQRNRGRMGVLGVHPAGSRGLRRVDRGGVAAGAGAGRGKQTGTPARRGRPTRGPDS